MRTLRYAAGRGTASERVQGQSPVLRRELGDIAMRIRELGERPAPQIRQLFHIWESSVKETHLFLSPSGIEMIGNGVPQALQAVPHLIIAEDTQALPVAFMGIDNRRLEMLFLAPEECGQGLGAAVGGIWYRAV